MQPSNEAVVASCQRAGLPVDPDIGGGLGIFDDTGLRWAVCPSNSIGSALFIVAVISGLKPGVEVWHTGEQWGIHVDVGENRYSEYGDTLTAACMAAIVSAYPEETT